MRGGSPDQNLVLLDGMPQEWSDPQRQQYRAAAVTDVYPLTEAGDAEFVARTVAGQYVFEEFEDVGVNDLLENRSLWEARVGFEFRF